MKKFTVQTVREGIVLEAKTLRDIVESVGRVAFVPFKTGTNDAEAVYRAGVEAAKKLKQVER